MATCAAIRLRRSAAQLHALASVERQIRAADPNSRRKYLREFAKAFQSYEAVLDASELRSVIGSANILLVGDYHALAASQLFAAELVEQLASAGRPVLLGLEMVFARDQRILDEWGRGEIDEAELRERIRFDLEWGYDWEPYACLLRRARKAGVRIYGLDCMPRGDLRRIEARDRHAASKLAELRHANPDAKIVVLFGESHLAPTHLPAMIRALQPRDRVLTVLQNVDSLYWRAAGEMQDRVEAVRVSPEVACVFSSTPLEKYESYRLYLERWSQTSSAPIDFATRVYNLVKALARALNIDQYSSHNHTQPRFLIDLVPEICSQTSASSLTRIFERKRLAREELQACERELGENGIWYLPRLNTMFVQRWDLDPAAEQVARFLHGACWGRLWRVPDHKRRTAEDGFYARVMETALADFGARVLHPARMPAREEDLYAFYPSPREVLPARSRFSYRDHTEMLDFLVFHKHYERSLRKYRAVPERIALGRRLQGPKLEFVSRALGQMLGTELYAAYIAGRVQKRFLRSLLFRDLDRPGVAHLAYFLAAHRTRAGRRR